MAALERRFVQIYLNDHLIGAAAGQELSRRMASTLRSPADREQLGKMSREIQADGQALREIMRSLDVPVRKYRMALGWTAEKLGRLKPNGRLASRSPLSDVVELEALYLGVSGKLAGWNMLREVADADPRLDAGELDKLIGKAEGQLVRLERLRRKAGSVAFVARPNAAAAS